MELHELTGGINDGLSAHMRWKWIVRNRSAKGKEMWWGGWVARPLLGSGTCARPAHGTCEELVWDAISIWMIYRSITHFYCFQLSTDSEFSSNKIGKPVEFKARQSVISHSEKLVVTCLNGSSLLSWGRQVNLGYFQVSICRAVRAWMQLPKSPLCIAW